MVCVYRTTALDAGPRPACMSARPGTAWQSGKGRLP